MQKACCFVLCVFWIFFFLFVIPDTNIQGEEEYRDYIMNSDSSQQSQFALSFEDWYVNHIEITQNLIENNRELSSHLGKFKNSAPSLSSPKSICVLYGNCQLLAVWMYLKNTFPEKYEYHSIVNWQLINSGDPLPVDLVKQADLFIYQPIQGHGLLDTDYIKKELLKKECACISVPYIYFLGYFPDYTRDPNNDKTISPKTPHGFFPEGHQRLMDYISMACYSPEKIIQISRRDDYIVDDFIWEKLYYGLEVLRNTEKSTDIKLSDFIEYNYKHFRLFHSVNHPANVLLKELMKQILPLMNLTTSNIENNVIFNHELLGGWTNPIIYPCVAKTLQLVFDTYETTYKGQSNVSYAEYIKEYIKPHFPRKL